MAFVYKETKDNNKKRSTEMERDWIISCRRIPAVG